jgi:sigma-70-like protein
VPLGNEIESVSTNGDSLHAWEVRAAIERLPANQRTALVLHELRGLSFAEIANRLGQSEPAIRALCFRARETMREELQAALSPLSCDEARELLASGSAPARGLEREVLRAHLRSCRACAREARRRRARRTMLGLLTGPFHKLADWLGLAAGSGPSAKLGVVLGAATIAAGIAGQPSSPPPSSDAPATTITTDRPIPAVAARASVSPYPSRPEQTASRPGGFPPGFSSRHHGDRPERPKRDLIETPNLQLPISSPVQSNRPSETAPPDEHQSASQPEGHHDDRPAPSTIPVVQATVEQASQVVTEAATELIPSLPEVAIPPDSPPLVTVPPVALPDLEVTAAESVPSPAALSQTIGPDVPIPPIEVPGLP